MLHPDYIAKYGALAAMHIEWEKIYIVVKCMDNGVKETLNFATFNDDWTIICSFQSNGLSVASVHKVCMGKWGKFAKDSLRVQIVIA